MTVSLLQSIALTPVWTKALVWTRHALLRFSLWMSGDQGEELCYKMPWRCLRCKH